MLCAPLGKQMADFEPLDTVFPAQSNPSLQLGKLKAVYALFYPYIHKLIGRSLRTNRGINGRCEYRSQNHVVPKLCIHLKILIEQVKICFTHDLGMMKHRNAVTMEPAGVLNTQFREFRRDNFHRIC